MNPYFLHLQTGTPQSKQKVKFEAFGEQANGILKLVQNNVELPSGPRQWKDFLKCFVQLRDEDDFKFYGYVIAITPHADLHNKQSVIYIFEIMRPHIYIDSVQDMRVHEIKVMISMQPGVPILKHLFHEMHRLQSRTKFREAEQWYVTWQVPRVDTNRDEL